MPDSAAIDRALVATLLGDATLAGLMPDGVYFDEAGGTATRFVIVSLVDEADDPMFDGRAFEEGTYLIKAVALNTSGGDVAAAAARIDALIEGATFAIAGYTLVTARRIARVRSTEIDDLDASIRWQHHGGRYQLTTAAIDS